MSPPHYISAQHRQPGFDKLSFVKYMKDIGRPYRNRAVALVSLCRFLVQTHEQSADAYGQLRKGLQAADHALESAAEARTATSKKASRAFAAANAALVAFEKDFPSKCPVPDQNGGGIVISMMTVAEAQDELGLGSPRVTLYALMDKLHGQLTDNQGTEPTRVVEFLLLKSLPPDDKSVVVRQMLSRSSSVQEVLWNFSRLKGDKRLTLGHNPHFYVDLPTSQGAYQGGFKTDPVGDFRHANKYYVLFDRPGWVFLKFGKKTRAFGNIWTTGPDSAIIFKDICGKLVGESVVGASIQCKPNLRYRTEPLLCPITQSGASPTTTSGNFISTSLTSSSRPVVWKPTQDWREPIRRALNAKDTSVVIELDKLPELPWDLPSAPSRKPSVSSHPRMKRARSSDGLPSSAPTQFLPAVTTGMRPNRRRSHSAPPSWQSLMDRTTSAPIVPIIPTPMPGHIPHLGPETAISVADAPTRSEELSTGPSQRQGWWLRFQKYFWKRK